MSEGIILDINDIKKLIAEKYGISPKDIIKTPYSWVIKKPGDEERPDE